MTPALYTAHTGVAIDIAIDYCRDLAETQIENAHTFRTLENRFALNRLDYCARVRERASRLGVRRMNVREDELLGLAKFEIKLRLRMDPHLLDHLVAIRAEQDKAAKAAAATAEATNA